MSFSSKNKGIDYKARLEYKLYLAREDPDLKFDLSDCDLKNVPKGVYSICKVLRKESLILKNNVLSSLSGGGSLEELSLLSVLDLRSNRLTALPDSIQSLSSLQELYLNNNLIKYLPEGIVRLEKLRVLSAPFNRLKRLPPNIDELSMLEEVCVQGNPALCQLPDRLSLCPRLSRLTLDVGRYTHPPDDVVLQGTSAVLSYLASRLGVEYSGVAATPAKSGPQSASQTLPSSAEQHIQAKLEEFERKKEAKQKECLALEKEMALQKDQEVLLQNELKKDKVKLVEDLKKQQMKIAEEVLRFQSQKEAEREKLIESLKQAEVEADGVVSRLLEMQRASREPWSILQQTELDRAAEQLIFHHRLTGDLKRKEIIAAMESLLEEECSKLTHYEETRSQIIKDSLSKQAEWDETVTALLRSGRRGSRPVELGDEAGQEAAVATLLERTDLESERLRAQLAIIEQQLAHITATELRRSRLSLDHITSELSVRRCQLSELLVEVLSQREARRGQLLTMLRRMEAIAQGEEDYWLEQYQKLVECQARLEPRLVRAMVLAGQHRHLPVLINLSSVDLRQLTSPQLAQAGVESEEDIAGILKAVRSYLSEEVVEPSAPPEDMPSAPSVEYQAECVVCMADQCEVVYVPCGHLCCCRSCSRQLIACPLCRGQILSKVIVIPVT